MTNNCPITKYQVTWSSVPPTSDDNVSFDLGMEAKSYNITDLKCNTNYTVIVNAYTSDTMSAESDAVSVTTNHQGKN